MVRISIVLNVSARTGDAKAKLGIRMLVHLSTKTQKQVTKTKTNPETNALPFKTAF